MLGAVSFLWRMDNLWHVMPCNDEQNITASEAPHERIRTTAKAKETDLKKVMVRLRYSDLLKKWQTFWKFGCRFFLNKPFAQGYLGLQIQLAKSLTSVGYAMRLNLAGSIGHQGPESCGFDPPIEWLFSCLGCTIRMVKQPFSIGGLEPWKKFFQAIFSLADRHIVIALQVKENCR